MNKTSVVNFRKFVFVLSLSLAAYLGYRGWETYRHHSSPFPFELASSELGSCGFAALQSKEGQENLLRMLILDGCFEQEKLWQDLHRIGVIKDPEKTFNHIYSSLLKVGVNPNSSGDTDLALLRKNFLKGSSLDKEDAKDLILYMAQNGFNRKIGQERYEITKDSKVFNVDSYLSAAKALQMVDRIEPKHQEYDQCWVFGASRPGLLKRLIDIEYVLCQKGIKITDKTYVLSGNRELWADIDGIDPESYRLLLKARQEKENLDNVAFLPSNRQERIEEGKKYIRSLDLVTKGDGLINPAVPFVTYKLGESPVGRFANREYPNYLKNGLKLTEDLMAQDLVSNLGMNASIIFALGAEGRRPDTFDTTIEACKTLIKDISLGKFGDKKEFRILCQTNNPYIERQTLVAKSSLSKALEEHQLSGVQITIEGIGFACGNSNSLETIRSELAVLISEVWKMDRAKNVQKGMLCKRQQKDLLFQTRKLDVVVPPYPGFSRKI